MGFQKFGLQIDTLALQSILVSIGVRVAWSFGQENRKSLRLNKLLLDLVDMQRLHLRQHFLN